LASQICIPSNPASLTFGAKLKQKKRNQNDSKELNLKKRINLYRVCRPFAAWIFLPCRR
jgi:hypothetical protein